MRTVGIVAAVAALSSLAMLASCSLGLDESLIERAGDGADAGTLEQDAAGSQGDDGASTDPTPDDAACAKDEDCTSAHGCLKGKCDLSRKTCVYDVCRSAVCSSSSCDLTAKTCGAAKTHAFKASQFAVNTSIGCGGALSRCFVAVYPFVFVGTPSGVIAFNASDPANPSPPQVPITGLGFVPGQIVASGNRVFFMGGTAIAGPAISRVALAWLDVPTDPLVTKLPATSLLATLNRPSGEPLSMSSRGDGTVMLVNPNAAANHPVALLKPPLVEPLDVLTYANTFAEGMNPVLATGSRLLMEQVSAEGTANFTLVDGAGSATPQSGAVFAAAAAGAFAGPQTFASSSEGAVFWGTSTLTAPANTPNPPGATVKAAHGVFLAADGAANLDLTKALDVETYAAGTFGAGVAVMGPATMLDKNTVLVTTATPMNAAQTTVQFVQREPLGIMKNADGSPRRMVLTVPPASMAATSSNGIAYLLAIDTPTTAVVHVFDPACAP